MSLKFILLGTGSSIGVPRIDGFFGKCDPKNPKNYRTRCSAIIKFGDQNILIDTSPDIRKQLLDNKITSISKVLISHHHADQTHGINDLRVFYLKNREKIPVFTNTITKKYLLNTFEYCFKKISSYPPTLKLNKIKNDMFFFNKKKKIFIKSIPVGHGEIKSLCFIINKKLAYASDINKIYKKDLRYFKNLKYLIIDCLRYDPHPSHYNLSEILSLIKVIKPQKTILTNMTADLDYVELKNRLPKNVEPAFDGLTLNL